MLGIVDLLQSRLVQKVLKSSAMVVVSQVTHIVNSVIVCPFCPVLSLMSTVNSVFSYCPSFAWVSLLAARIYRQYRSSLPLSDLTHRISTLTNFDYQAA